MDVSASFSAKLEPFLLMSKSAKGAAAAKLVQDATSAPGVFVFAELLDLPNIQELKDKEQFAKWFALLQVFSYKTYQDYLQRKDELPPLNTAQTTKLKYLSIVSLASDRRILPYTDLLAALQMPSIRDLEDLVIDAIYLNLLRGKLDQKEQQLEVEYTMGRDLKPGQIEGVLSALRDWTETTQRVLQALDTSLSSLASQKAASAMELEEHERIYNANVKEILDRHKESKMASPMPMGRRGLSSLNGSQGLGQALGQALGGLMPGEGMDVDEPESKGKSRRLQELKQLRNKRSRP